MERIGRVRSFVVAITVTGIVTSCTPSPAAPSQAPADAPLPPFASQPEPQPGLSPSRFSGVVFEVTEQGRRPLAAATINVVDLLYGPYEYPWHQLITNSNGEFTIPAGSLLGRRVKITAFENGGLPGFGLELFQLRAVHVTLEGDAISPVEVELTRRGVQPGKMNSPLLTGVVFQTTGEGRRAAADKVVIYSSNRHDGMDVYARTDAEGRYRFGNLPLGSGYVLVWCTETFSPTGYVQVDLDLRGDTVQDLTCP